MVDPSSWPPPPPPAYGPSQKPKSGCVVFLVGILVAFAPMLIVAVAALFVGAGVWNESESSLGALPWLMILTFPAGGIVCVVGFVLWVTELSRRKK